ncbi:hypothetical protein VTO42DRAFT_5072 [Malbranchea cinnamomea]
MEITFITLQDISRDGRIRFASQSIEDIIGWKPEEVTNKSVWEFIHPDDVAKGLAVYEENLHHDGAARLDYFRVRHKQGHWVRCETLSTVVYNVMVASTTIYSGGPASAQRAADAAVVGKFFVSKRDPEYHILSTISRAFSHTPSLTSPEPRAAMILNRFTRLSTIIYATSNTAALLGVPPAQLLSKSFYYCVEECCLRDAIQCIESSKASDSVAYLRFWFRNPVDDNLEGDQGSTAQGDTSDDDHSPVSTRSSAQDSLFSIPPARDSRAGGACPVEVEAVVSCSSDGLIVVLRRAAGPVPENVQQSGHPVYVPSSRPSSAGSSQLGGNSKPLPTNLGGPDVEALVASIRQATLFGMGKKTTRT